MLLRQTVLFHLHHGPDTQLIIESLTVYLFGLLFMFEGYDDAVMNRQCLTSALMGPNSGI